MPECWSVNALKQNILTMDSSVSSHIRAGRKISGCCLAGKAPSMTWRCRGGNIGTGAIDDVVGFGWVLCMPWRGHFMCPCVVAGLGFRYLSINFSDIFGHPFRDPLRTAFSSVDIFGLQSDWCMNLAPLPFVCMECMKNASWTPECNVQLGCGAHSRTGEDCDRADCIPSGVMGNVHKSVDGSLYPLKITLPSNLTSHLLLSKITRHPALQSRCIPTSYATAKAGRMCLIRTAGKPGMAMSHRCVDCTLCPSGRLIVNGLDATHLLATSTPSMTKMDVAPVSAIACNVPIVIAFKSLCEVGSNNARAAIAHAHGICVRTRTLLEEEQFDMITVVSSLHSPVAKV